MGYSVPISGLVRIQVSRPVCVFTGREKHRSPLLLPSRAEFNLPERRKKGEKRICINQKHKGWQAYRKDQQHAMVCCGVYAVLWCAVSVERTAQVADKKKPATMARAGALQKQHTAVYRTEFHTELVARKWEGKQAVELITS